MRSDQEAWDLALANRELVYFRLGKILRSNTNQWYKGKDLMAEIESYAWEGLFKACRYWDESKGKLSTYAVPTIDRTIYQALKVLFRLGGNVRTGGSEPRSKNNIPYVLPTSVVEEQWKTRLTPESSSLDSIDITIGLRDSVDTGFELELIDKLSAEQFKAELISIVELMDEPYKSVYTLMHLTEPTHHRANNPGTAGWTLREVASKLGVALETVRKYKFEAEEFVYNQLLARGYGKDEE